MNGANWRLLRTALWRDALCACLIALAALTLLRPPDTAMSAPAVTLDHTLQSQLYPPEIGADARTFRWTNGRSTVSLPVQGVGDHVLALTLAAPGQRAGTTATIMLKDRPFAALTLSAEPRHYTLLLPASRAGYPRTTVTIASDTFRAPGDVRELGVVVYGVRYAVLAAQTWLPPLQALTLLAACLALVLALRRLQAPALAVVLLFAALSLALGLSELRFVERVNATLLTLALALAFAAVAVVAHLRHAAPVPETIQLNQPPAWAPGRLVLLFGVLALVPMAPVLADPAHLLLGIPGDNFEYAWKMQWFVDALLGERRSVLFQPNFFYPAGFDLARSELTPAHTLLGIPFTLLAGPVASANIALYLSYVSTGVLATLLAARYGAGRLGALVCGIGLAFCVHRYAYSLGTLPMAGTQWVILAWYGWEGFLQRQRPRDAALAGIGLALSAWASWYYAPPLAILLAIYTLVRCRDWRALLAAWRGVLVAVLVAAALVVPYTLPYLALDAPPHSRNELLGLSARPLGYLLPSPFHPLWGAWAAALAASMSATQYVSIGWGVFALAVIGAIRYRRQPAIHGLLAVALVAFILSLGPQLRIGETVVVLPVEWIYEHVPGLRNIRVWSRMSFFVEICAGVLAGLALTGYRSWPRWHQSLAAAAIALVLIESVNVPPVLSPVAPGSADAWLAAQPDDRPIIHMPDILSGKNEFDTLFNRRRLVAGYGTFYPEYFLHEYAALQDFPAVRSITALRRLGTGYVVISKAAMDRQAPGWQATLAGSADLDAVYDDGTTSVYRVRPAGER